MVEGPGHWEHLATQARAFSLNFDMRSFLRKVILIQLRGWFRGLGFRGLGFRV